MNETIKTGGPMRHDMEVFEINIPEKVIVDLKARLANTRWPDHIPGTGWTYGADIEYIKQLCDYWQTRYDWRIHEKTLNRFPQFKTVIDDHAIHFIHARSQHENATPLLISHGWPGSVVEFMKIIDPLTDPESHGGDADDAFHVICPSLPGYGFSEPTKCTGMDTHAMASIFARLMARLGYDNYIAQGGDWGALITSNLGVLDAGHVMGIHLNMPLGLPGKEEPNEELSDQEKADLADLAYFNNEETGYQKIQGTKPQSLGVGLNDSPAGLAAWITEKFYTWTDCNGDIESVITKDELLTNIMVYWVTQTITASTRLYYETTKNPELKFMAQKVAVPTGIARFPKEIMRFPRKWVERVYTRIVHWTDFDKGGHFAAMEQPQKLVIEIRSFAKKIRR
jgi:pimeloyl-ACP methyl ester carboxylesterase